MRGPYQHFTSITANNLLRIHDAFTASYAGVLPERATSITAMAKSHRALARRAQRIH